MRRRWSLLAATAIVATPVLVACGDDDSPSEPTVTLFEGTNSPNVSTGTSG